MKKLLFILLFCFFSWYSFCQNNCEYSLQTQGGSLYVDDTDYSYYFDAACEAKINSTDFCAGLFWGAFTLYDIDFGGGFASLGFDLPAGFGITAFAVANLKINEDIYSNPLYLPSLSVEKVNALAAQGVPFRDAYKQIGLEVAAGTFQAKAPESAAALGHTHAGSIGNLCTAQIAARFNKTLEAFLISILTKD